MGLDWTTHGKCRLRRPKHNENKNKKRSSITECLEILWYDQANNVDVVEETASKPKKTGGK